VLSLKAICDTTPNHVFYESTSSCRTGSGRAIKINVRLKKPDEK